MISTKESGESSVTPQDISARTVGRFEFVAPPLDERQAAGLVKHRLGRADAQIEYVVLRPDGPSRGQALLVPGFTAGHEDFGELMMLIAEHGWEVASLSQRGQSFSTGPDSIDGYSLPILGDDVAAVLDALGWDSAHVLGHSFGGVVAIEAAIRHPHRISSLTLWNSGPRREASGFAIYLDEFLAAGHAALLDERMPLRGSDPVQAWYAQRLLRTERAQLEAALRHMLYQEDRTAELAALGLRVLVSHGEHDAAWSPTLQREMAARLHADYVVVADAGHCAHWDRPDFCARILRAFWGANE